jgi:integrase
VEQFRQEKMPRRCSTRRGYETWLTGHILPHWGNRQITEVQARTVELWLESLSLSPKSKVHIRGLLRALWEYAMWRGDVPTQRNPMELVTIKGATKRTRQPRSLTVEEFQKLVTELEQPIRTVALVCACFGLRISECLALKWCDVDWLQGKLRVERAIVHQRVDTVKTVYSQKKMSMDAEMLEVFKAWRQQTEFGERLNFLQLKWHGPSLAESLILRGILRVRCSTRNEHGSYMDNVLLVRILAGIMAVVVLFTLVIRSRRKAPR